MSQNARVARWVPTVVPDSVGEGVITTAAPAPSGVLATKFALAGGGGGVAWADDAEMADGTETLKAVAPATLREETMRELAMPSTHFTDPLAIAAPAGTALDNGRLVKTDNTGRLDVGFMPLVLDGGTF